MKTQLEKKALLVATTAHKAVGQKRKYTGADYIVHPIEVAELVKTIPNYTEEMVCAGLLHDVVEDTGITIEFITEHFGEKVSELVGWLTDVSVREDGNRATRKAIDREHSTSAPAEAQSIKCCDLISNSLDIAKADKDFAVVYMREKRLLLEGMTKAHKDIIGKAWEILKNYEQKQ